MQDHLYALIMAGGGGTRLWPLSRREHPKQMLDLLGDRTMFQMAVDRLLPLLPPEQIFVVTAAEQVAPLAEQVPALPRENFVVEPMGRGTAPCVGLSALHLRERDPDAVMAVLTADHYIRRKETFRAALQAAQQVAEEGYLVTMGIEPTFPSTGYGYIRQGEELGQAGEFDYYEVQRFTEKPDAETAAQFLASGDYAWNSGMFIWRVERILDEIHSLMPDLSDVLQTLGNTLGGSEYETCLQEHWPGLQKETLDYGIMEKADRVAVIPVDLGWSDVGTWGAVMELREADAMGNVLRGNVLPVDTENSMILAQGGRLVATVGVENLIVVDSPDALLITRPDRSQDVREVVDRLREEEREEYL